MNSIIQKRWRWLQKYPGPLEYGSSMCLLYQVMASNGLWDVVSNTDVVNIIRDAIKEPGMCAKRLATEAAEQCNKDNITVIIVFLCPVSTAERRHS